MQWPIVLIAREDLNQRTSAELEPGGGGGALPINGLMGMCRWMGSHFHDWTDYNGVAFSSIFIG